MVNAPDITPGFWKLHPKDALYGVSVITAGPTRLDYAVAIVENTVNAVAIYKLPEVVEFLMEFEAFDINSIGDDMEPSEYISNFQEKARVLLDKMRGLR